ncbi:type I pullulanase [Rufibacter glacialis]|uniref:Type I pullulanase n=1 Tax=Rufibacter glacialis TaxID=1259555 RepID=A0A5M8QMR2_9BACT|nr:type I pullulanase [Rufibacter glacialis]KAA6437507.1 type I pullulanase [Rufibacter glacialis]GGK58747.1 type I pullulanase [Rufibacter glacialis]
MSATATWTLTHRFDQYPTPVEANLWLAYSPQQTTFRLWTPVAEEVVVKLYEAGQGGTPQEKLALVKGEKGVWSLTVHQDLHGVYYTYQVKVNGHWLDETPGIYAQAVGVNGHRAMVLDLASTDPPGWDQDKGPPVKHPNEAILWEAHVRDLTSHASSGSATPGKFLGLIEKGTTTESGLATGIDHLKELGITHVHLLPAFDHMSIDETVLENPPYNWGYDPLNYNVPEGSYSTDPFRAEVRIREFKQMVKGFHDQGLGVVLDVVYNHTGLTKGSPFNLEFPEYYYRQKEDGHYSDASGCGNETASERAMMRKFMIESCQYWAKGYHLDGFRFDLMAIHDLETMNLLSAELRKINPHLLIYGEGWTAGSSPLPDHVRALKTNTHLLQHTAAFSDDLRDAIKGSVFDNASTGFVSGAQNTEESIKFGVAGSVAHAQVDLEAVNYSQTFWARAPWQAVSYSSCHDNLTLYDKLRISRPDASPQLLQKMHLLADAIVLTSQGVPFLHAGAEMLRTKNGEHNSYNLPDELNQINWGWKETHQEVFTYYQGLIALRKAHPAFFMPTSEMVNRHLAFVPSEPGLVGFLLKDHAHGDSWKNILVYYNSRETAIEVQLQGQWTVAAEGEAVQLQGGRLVQDQIAIPPVSMLVLFQE